MPLIGESIGTVSPTWIVKILRFYSARSSWTCRLLPSLFRISLKVSSSSSRHSIRWLFCSSSFVSSLVDSWKFRMLNSWWCYFISKRVLCSKSCLFSSWSLFSSSISFRDSLWGSWGLSSATDWVLWCTLVSLVGVYRSATYLPKEAIFSAFPGTTERLKRPLHDESNRFVRPSPMGLFEAASSWIFFANSSLTFVKLRTSYSRISIRLVFSLLSSCSLSRFLRMLRIAPSCSIGRRAAISFCKFF